MTLAASYRVDDGPPVVFNPSALLRELVFPPVAYGGVWAEWVNRADMHAQAFDGQWRVLMAYPGVDLLERWGPEKLEHCLRKT
jgi:hypothetical protein